MKLLKFNASGHPAVALFLGTLLTLSAGFTLLTTQMLFIYGFVPISRLHYGWGVVGQLYGAVNGEYAGINMVAVVFSFILLACYMMANAIRKWVKAGIAHEGLEFFCHLMIVLDGIANWTSLTGVAWYWQALFTLSIYVVLAYFGKIVAGQLTLAVMEFI